ncbi:MAG TPA: biotin--[acetyl-CoA-carboxylase] ligase [Bacteroidia bacterium]|nr:biotin--[acetyl-CoA-carboxylase] ligase [Bacteroidia bacterium]
MKTLFIGQNAIYVKSLASTNSYASELLRQIGLLEGSLIYTFEQEKGRGQRGNTWESEPNKNLTLSLVLHPHFLDASQQFLLTKITSLAVADLMAEFLGSSSYSARIHIKWPNDIYVNDKKIAGILIENYLRENSIQHAIVGVGINVNQTVFQTAPNALSLAGLTQTTFDLKECLERFCSCFEARYLQLKNNKLQQLHEDYLFYLYRLNEWSTYRTINDHLFEGNIKGVSGIGKLQVELVSGEIKEFDLKEIAFTI